jgi:hypothetical protein
MGLLAAYGNPFVIALAAFKVLFNQWDLSMCTPTSFCKIRPKNEMFTYECKGKVYLLLEQPRQTLDMKNHRWAHKYRYKDLFSKKNNYISHDCPFKEDRPAVHALVHPYMQKNCPLVHALVHQNIHLSTSLCTTPLVFALVHQVMH